MQRKGPMDQSTKLILLTRMRYHFVTKIPKHLTLQKYPDILHQITRKSFKTINQSNESNPFNTSTIQTSANISNTSVAQPNIQQRAGPSHAFQPGYRINNSTTRIQRNIERNMCPFRATLCNKRSHEGLPALLKHLNMDHFQALLNNNIIEEQKRLR